MSLYIAIVLVAINAVLALVLGNWSAVLGWLCATLLAFYIVAKDKKE